MNGRSWNIQVAEGGFIVEIYTPAPPPPEQESIGVGRKLRQRVFSDSSALINFLHNELVGSN